MNTNDELVMQLQKLLAQVHPDLFLLLSILLDHQKFRQFTFWDFDSIATNLLNQDFENDIIEPDTDLSDNFPLFMLAKEKFIQRITDRTMPFYDSGDREAVFDNHFKWAFCKRYETN